MSGKGKYKDTLNLPQTGFPMRGGLAKREPEFLAEWEKSGLYQKLEARKSSAKPFILHDGPPYSNGNIHYGHILNKLLKDIIVKYKTMAGFYAPYIPGWDTHGLSIELAVDRELGKKKREMSKADIREECRKYALKFVDLQREEFKRLGVFGQWGDPYLTLLPYYDASIVRALASFSRGGYLYRGKKPVYWCPKDNTALAEAEIEYANHTSPSIYVRFPLADDFKPETLSPSLKGKTLALAIWTTTPWTIPSNLAVVLSRDFEYVAIPSRKKDEYLLVAKELSESVNKAMDNEGEPTESIEISKEALATLEGVQYRHPFVESTEDNFFRIWFADYVTLEQGTGLVHTAPGHGADDYRTGMAHGLPPYAPIDDAGKFTDEVPKFQGQTTWDANPKIVQYLDELGVLLNKPGESVHHSYPHCWRCKGPVLFRATDQWFVGIDHNEMRNRALGEIENTEWIPGWGQERIRGMIANRPDWCLSRQRIWGVPIPAFYCDDCGDLHADPEIMEHVATIFETEGSDAWYKKSIDELKPPSLTTCKSCGSDKFRAEQDIVDVWFESGCSWFAVGSKYPEISDIDLYLEGSDQHRGWFHSSLLIGVGMKGKAPYKSVITHGFVLNEEGTPYSKSDIERARKEGRKVKYVPPEDVIKKYGAEMFRLWVASTEFRGDIPYSEKLLSGLIDWYRKFRNASRFMLGNLSDFDPGKHPLSSVNLSEVDNFALAKLGDLVARIRESYDKYELHVVYRALVDYLSTDLSSQYLDVIKDHLYSNAANSPARRATQAVLYTICNTLSRIVAPILCFTAEDIWQHLPESPNKEKSVHLADLPKGKRLDENDEIVKRWTTFIKYRELATKELEAFRAQKNRSEDAQITISPTKADRAWLASQEPVLEQLFIVSKVVIAKEDSESPKLEVAKAGGNRCERCWRWYENLSKKTGDTCERCAEACEAN